ncbi:putative exported protein [Halobacteriovorax marinus SJ]|uniref:phospholipase D n=1 Tax=Halobacteriovorax marinus (strain ATCC BAA-682 / DSM 15412 / SJ) TaxID=862908 RepID=E1X1K1_HALMS|nr:phospholipase D-like domain-containing protein [Halobacteriovorax marinus]CBW28169.1 putative exported protein [Halobacteriovorax marinus SJ]
MKLISIILFTLLSLSSFADTKFYSKFSPHEGAQAFEIIYKEVKESKKYVYATIYSWSDKGITDSFKEALQNGVEVKIILHPSLAKKSSIKKVASELEALGADLKIAKMNMHEKFVLVDDVFVVNSSANMSGGAKNRYSENFIYHSDETVEGKSVLSQFKKEFIILWNSAKDIFTANEGIAEKLNLEALSNSPINSNASLYSSSMNFKIKENKPSSKAYKQGKYYTLSRIGGVKNQTWTVRDIILDNIKNAKSNIYLSLNHFNIREISDALIEAVKRGVDVKLAVDNQEFKTRINNKEMTPQFVSDWKALPGNKSKIAPVRVKYYSHSPSPRHWLLNHHKFIIVDYNESNFEETKLISGSYNLSKTAEHNQFDNMVVYKSVANKALFKSFKEEFDNQWFWNRDSSDKPKKEMIEQFTNLKDGTSIALHMKEAVSLNWKEVLSLRSKVSRAAKGFFRGLYSNKDCLYYDVTKSSFWGCPR